MRIYNEWMSDKDYFGDNYPNNMLLNDAKIRFEIQKKSLEGRNALVDGVSERIVVQNHTNPLNQARFDKKLSFDIDSSVHTGSVIEFDNKVWLIIDKIFDKYAYKVGSVLECINNISLSCEGVLHQIPYIIFDNTSLTRMGYSNTEYFPIPYSRMMVMIPDNKITRSIKRNDVFDFYKNMEVQDNYTVIDINKIRKPGLIILEMEWTSNSQNLSTYSIVVSNGSDIQLAALQTISLNVKVYKDNNVIIHKPTDIVYISSDDQIIEVDINGNITAISEGLAQITVSYGNTNQIINISVTDIVQDQFTYEIVGDSEIIKNNTKQYMVKKYNNGILIDGAKFEFSIVGDEIPSSAYKLSVINDTSCSIEAKSNTYIVTLRATDDDGYIDKTIKLRSIF